MSIDLKGKRIVITIGREYGSGGRQIGKLVSSMLGIPFYDKELLNRAASDSGLSGGIYEKVDFRRSASLLYSLVRRIENSGYEPGLSELETDNRMTEKVFQVQKQVIKNIADEGSCVVIGRCSNIILANARGAVHFYIKAPYDYKVPLLKITNNMEPKKAAKYIKNGDKARSGYYKYYTGRKWGDPQDYNYVLDSSVLGVDGTAELIVDIVEKKLGLK